MNRLQRHRGPDGEGIWQEGNIALGHVRLSIIDLSSAASQPMVSVDGRFVITYNGEIYNYRELQSELRQNGIIFKTDSDTEVILALFSRYGLKCIERLRGMFAFAIWDRKKEELTVVRDRIGIKPLYYWKDEEKIIFASEIKAIASVIKDMTLNLSGFYTYFRTSLYENDQTVFENIKQLQPGHFAVINLQKDINAGKYWDLKEYFSDKRKPDSFNMTVSKLDEILKESVRYHNVSDVPVGTFLSGGLDSSLVTAMSARLNKGMNTISMVFPGNAPYYDEDEFSSYMASKLNTNHRRIYFSGNFLGELGQLAWYADEPFGIASAYALFELSREMRKSNKVVLTGDGADELFGGYYRLYENDLLKYSNYRYLLNGLAEIIKPFISFSGDRRLCNLYLKLISKSGNKSFNFSQSSSYSSTNSFSVLSREYIFEALGKWKNNSRMEYYEEILTNDYLKKKIYSLMKTRLIDEMLKKVDRMSMANSLEARVPLLDYKLVEYAAAIPSEFLYRKQGQVLETKFILRKVSERYLPSQIINRVKHGFNIPFKDWIKDRNEIITDTVNNGFLQNQGIIDLLEVNKMIDKHNNGEHNAQYPILNLYCFESWYKSYKSNIPGFNLTI